jgi:hypothetical protein
VEHQGQGREEGGRRRLPAIFPLVIYHGEAARRIPKAEGKADMLLRLLRRRFDSLPEAVVAKVRDASEDQLNEWADNILDARNLDMVFGSAKPN